MRKKLPYLVAFVGILNATLAHGEEPSKASGPNPFNHPRPSQAKYTISGYVTENGSRENLIGVSVFVPELQHGTVSNDYGFFSLTLPEGSHEVVFPI